MDPAVRNTVEHGIGWWQGFKGFFAKMGSVALWKNWLQLGFAVINIRVQNRLFMVEHHFR